MTIGELEAALDMPRANIRFYEQEGFIHPRRGRTTTGTTRRRTRIPCAK
ncbi:helix-turn-helix domain-containing protein [Flavonifractor plautii]|nr:helix-turn-helix domain-containing protein [Flavonifractor plautii]